MSGTQLRNARYVADERRRRGSRCEECGAKEAFRQQRPGVLASSLDFHHRDPATKLFSVGSPGTCSLLRLREELAKCDLLCRRCHPSSHGQHLREDEKDTIVALYAEGHTAHSVARLVGRATSTVYKALIARGVVRRPTGPAPHIL